MIAPCLALALSLWGAPRSLSAFDPAIRLVGRFDSTSQGARLSWSGTGLQIAFEGKSCKARFASTGSVLGLFVDGIAAPNLDLVSVSQDTLIVLAQNLTSGRHVVELIKKTEASVGAVVIKEILLDGNPTALPQPARRHIEFLGNSITCGYGVLDSVKEHHFTPYSEDFTASYAAISAKMLGADLQAICYSGKGLVRNWGGGTDSTIPALFSQTGLPAGGKPWNFARWKPDVVVIDLGQNDFSQAPFPDSAKWESAWMVFLETIRQAHGEVPLVLLDGPMLSDGWPQDATGKPLEALSKVRHHLHNVASRAKTKGFTSVTTLSFTPNSAARGYGADWHPNRAQQALNSQELINHLKKTMNW